MCPLRVILIFLSATLAGFFVLRRLKAQPEKEEDLLSDNEEGAGGDPVPFTTKVQSAICSGFLTCIDMASGRYLWRNLQVISSSSRNGGIDVGDKEL